MVKTSGLKLLRVKKGLKAYEVAARVGIHPSQLSLIETGRREPDKKLAQRIRTSIREIEATRPQT